MSPDSFSVLLLATAVSVGMAGWAVTERYVPASNVTLDEPMFPGLAERVPDVAAVEVKTDGDTFTIRRDGETWRLVERGGYPADQAKLREVVRGLAGLRLVEAKTASEDRLPRLDLGDPSAADAKSKLVSLQGSDGKPIASVVIGKSKYSLFGSGRGGVYVRRDGEDQAWLAAGEITVPNDALGWLVNNVVDLPEKDITRITLGDGGSDPITITRPDPDAEALTLDQVPEGRKADEEALSRVASVLDHLTMSDVRKSADKPLPADAPKARFETRDGIVVTVASTVEGDGEKEQHWVEMQVSEGQPVPPAAEATTASTTEAPSPPAEGEAKANQAEEEPSEPAATPEKPLAERVAELKAKLEGWQFELPSYIAERLTYDREKLLAKPEGTS